MAFSCNWKRAQSECGTSKIDSMNSNAMKAFVQ